MDPREQVAALGQAVRVAVQLGQVEQTPGEGGRVDPGQRTLDRDRVGVQGFGQLVGPARGQEVGQVGDRASRGGVSWPEGSQLLIERNAGDPLGLDRPAGLEEEHGDGSEQLGGLHVEEPERLAAREQALAQEVQALGVPARAQMRVQVRLQSA